MQQFLYIILMVAFLPLIPVLADAPDQRLDTLARRLVQASRAGDVNKIRALLRAGADANRPTGDPNSYQWPLLEAVKNHHFLAADALRAGGASFSKTREALYYAAGEPDLPALEYALKRGVKPNSFYTPQGYSLLTWCISNSFADTLPSEKKRRLNAIRVLLRGGANPNLLDKMGSGAIHDAATSANLSWIKILLEFGANPNVADKDGDTALILSVAPGTFTTVTESADAIDSIERRAVRMLLIEKGANVNVKNKRGVAPIHMASAENFTAAIDDLIAHGANVNERGFGGATPLHVAMRYGAFDAAQKLIALGADRELRDNAECLVLDYAQVQVVSTDWELTGKSNLDIVETLKYPVQEGRAKIAALLRGEELQVESH